MNIPFFFENFTDQQNIFLSDANTHYILDVLRMKEGESICVVNGHGEKAVCVLRNVMKRSADIEVEEFISEESRKINLHIGISFTKNAARMEWFLEKATELGIETITPLLTHRSERTFFKKERFEKVLISAMLQSQQCYLPYLNEPQLFGDIFNTKADQRFVAYCGTEYEKIQLHQVLKPSKDTLFLIGPEGDFTADEVHLCRQHQFEVVQLGSNRLRTETAGLYVCTLFNAIQ